MEELLTTRRTQSLYERACEFYAQKLQLKALMYWVDYVRAQYRKKLDSYFNPRLNKKSAISTRTHTQSFEQQPRSRNTSFDASRGRALDSSDLSERFGDYSSIMHIEKSPVRLYSFCQEFTQELDKLIQDEENVIEYYYSKLIMKAMKTWFLYTNFRRKKVRFS